MMNNGQMGWGEMGSGYGGMLFGGSMMFLGLALVVVLIVFLVKWLGGDDRSPVNSENRSLHILKDRYAAGEIDKTEFEDKRRALFS
jgi:putative membrane protein